MESHHFSDLASFLFFGRRDVVPVQALADVGVGPSRHGFVEDAPH